jgi:hypothetical protein
MRIRPTEASVVATALCAVQVCGLECYEITAPKAMATAFNLQ